MTRELRFQARQQQSGPNAASYLPAALDEIEQLEAENATLRDDNARLRAARRNQRGDDLCWIGDEAQAKALPEAAFLESCRRYRNQIAAERGEYTGGKTIAQLEACRALHEDAAENLLGQIDAARALAGELAQALVEMRTAVRGEIVMNNPKYDALGHKVTSLIFRHDVQAVLKENPSEAGQHQLLKENDGGV